MSMKMLPTIPGPSQAEPTEPTPQTGDIRVRVNNGTHGQRFFVMIDQYLNIEKPDGTRWYNILILAIGPPITEGEKQRLESELPLIYREVEAEKVLTDIAPPVDYIGDALKRAFIGTEP